MITCADAISFDFPEADVMIVDPPYREHVHKAATSQSAKGGARHRDLGFDHLNTQLQERIAWLAGNRVKRWSVIFTDTESVGFWKEKLENNGATYIRCIPWVRWSMPQLSGDRPPQGHEMILLAWGTQKGKKNWYGPGNLTHFSQTCLRGEGKHKCEKPLDLMLQLVSWFSDRGERVIDPCSGSGSTWMACHLLCRNFTGTETDPEWVKKATARIMSGELSERDRERYARWQAEDERIRAEMARMKATTEKAKMRGVVNG